MTRFRIVIATITLMLPLAGVAQASSQSTHLTASTARMLVKTADNRQQYMQLADYFHQRETMYRAKAADEKIEWDRRAQVNEPSYQKFPRPVDSAHSLYNYYVQCADAAATKASHYDHLASDAFATH